MTTARMVVTETAPLPYPDDDWTALVKVYLIGDAIDSWQVESYVLHRRGQPSRPLAPPAIRWSLPALTSRLDKAVESWLDVNRSRIAREPSG